MEAAQCEGKRERAGIVGSIEPVEKHDRAVRNPLVKIE
jgi:hypothetical protein